MSMFDSPYIVPLGAFAVAIVAIIGGVVNQINKSHLKAQQRIAMMARGIPMAEIEAVLSKEAEQEERPTFDPMRRVRNARVTAMVLISTGLGIIAFLSVVAYIVRTREVLAGAAVGLIPLAIGIGFLIDYRMQKREMSRFGLEMENDMR